MSRAANVKRIFIHCSAGYGDIESQKRYWKSLGWKSVGYHRQVTTDGVIHKLADFESIVNGVKNYNSSGIHLCYQGGVRRDNVNIAEDTRNDLQKKGLYTCIEEALDWLFDKGVDVSKIKILGHRDISPDKNLNGKVDKWEWLKQCPSFDAIPEYQFVVDNYVNNRPLDFIPK